MTGPLTPVGPRPTVAMVAYPGMTMLDLIGPYDTQLLVEYDPDPPFDSGSPLTASDSEIEAIRKFVAPLNAEIASLATV